MLTFVQLLYGPILIGVMFNIMLYGVMFTQTYLYYCTYKDDPRWIKIFVFVLFLCDTVDTGLDMALIYVPLVNHFGDFQTLTRANWMFASESALTAVIASLVQCFFAWRLKVLTSSNWIVAFTLLCSVTQLLGGIGCTLILAVEPSFAKVRGFRFMGIIWIVSAALANVTIAVALVWHLWRHKTGVAATDNVVNKIIRLIVPTGFLTALFAVMTLLLYFVSNTGYNLIFHLPLAKLYTNSLMSTLNSRRVWMSDICEDSTMSRFETSGRRSGVNVNVIRSDCSGRTRPPDRIVIGVESHQMIDFNNVKNHRYASSAISSVPEDKKTSAAGAV